MSTSMDDLIDQLLEETIREGTKPAQSSAQEGASVPTAVTPSLNTTDSPVDDLIDSASSDVDINRLRVESQRLNLQIKLLRAENEALKSGVFAAQAGSTAAGSVAAPSSPAAPVVAAPAVAAASTLAFLWKRHIAMVEDSLRKKDTSTAESVLNVLVDVAEAIVVEPAARARLLTQLATIRIEQGRSNEAEETLNTALKLLESNGGHKTLPAAFCLDALAQCHQLRESFEQAEKLRRQAVIIGEDSLGAEHPDVAYFRDRLDALRQEQAIAQIGADDKTVLDKLTDEYNAQPEESRGLKPEDTVLDTYSGFMFDKYMLNSKNAIAQKNPREAESFLRSAMEKAEGIPNSDPRKCEGMRLLAQILESQNKDNEAKELYEKAISTAFRHIGWHDIQIAHALYSLAELHNRMDDFGLAKNYYKQALTNLTAGLGKDHETTQEVQAKFDNFLDRVKQELQWKGWSN